MDWNERMAKIAAEKQKLGITNLKLDSQPAQPAIKADQKNAQKPAAPPINSTINKELQKELQKEQRRLSNLEAELNKAKELQMRLEAALGDPAHYAAKDKFVAIEAEYKKAKNDREVLDKQYEMVFEKVMELETRMG